MIKQVCVRRMRHQTKGTTCPKERLVEWHEWLTVQRTDHHLSLFPSLYSTLPHTSEPSSTLSTVMCFHPTPAFCLNLLTSVSGSSSKRCRSCPRNYNTSTVYIILTIRNYHFFFVDQRWLVAIVHIVQPNAFLTLGILSQYSFFFLSPLSCCTLYYSSKTDNNKSNKEVQAKGKWISFKLTFSCFTSNSKSSTFVTGLPWSMSRIKLSAWEHSFARCCN